MVAENVLVDRDNMEEMAKPLFYGYALLAAVTMVVSPRFAGTFLGVAMVAAISMVASGISGMLEDDWQRFMDIIALVTLLSSLLAGSYLATILSMG